LSAKLDAQPRRTSGQQQGNERLMVGINRVEEGESVKVAGRQGISGLMI
jgi:hypothetical protein